MIRPFDTDRRRPLVALFAALVLPGLGQVYCGDVAGGAALLFSLALVLPATAWLALHGPRAALSPLMWLGCAAALAVYVRAVVAATRAAARAGADFRRGAWNRLPVYAALLVFGHLFVLAPMVAYTRDHLIETFLTPTGSMQPTILPGDRFFADKRVGRPGGRPLWRGALTVFVYPDDRSKMFIKRVIGLPGDRVEISGTSIKVNGVERRGAPVLDLGDPERNRLLADHLAFRESGDRGAYDVLWPRDPPLSPPFSTVVPNGQVFVLGDNRGGSQDSRRFGTVPLADVTAVARQVWLSIGPDGPRWGRLAQTLE
jgi:signal peptidase I